MSASSCPVRLLFALHQSSSNLRALNQKVLPSAFSSNEYTNLSLRQLVAVQVVSTDPLPPKLRQETVRLFCSPWLSTKTDVQMTNSGSASQSQDIPTDESKKKAIDNAPKNAPPREKSDGSHQVAPDVDVSPSPSPPNAELADSFINDGPNDASAVDEEGEEQELTREETGTEPEEAGVQMVDIAKLEPQGTIQKNPLSPSQTAKQFEGGDMEKKEPVISKQAVQDPGLVDFTDLPSESNIIDVDIFDDDVEDVSEDDAAHSPIGEEFVSEAEDPDDPKNVDTVEVLARSSQSEAIDLTESPSTKPTESAKQVDSGDLNMNDTSSAERMESITGMPVDVDESRESADATKMKEADRGSETHDDAFSITKSDGHLDESTPDTDTVSADVNIDVNGDDISPQQICTGDDSSSQRPKGGLDIDYAVDDARHIEPDGDQKTTAAKSDGVGDDETQRNDSKGKTQSEVIPADTLDVDRQDSVNRNTEPEMVKGELEDNSVNGDSSTMPTLENEGIDDRSAVIVLYEKVDPKEEEALPGSNDSLQTEESQEKSIHSVPRGGHLARYDKNSVSILRSNVIGEIMTVPSVENQSSFDQVTSEKDTASEPFARSPKLQDEKAKAERVAAVIANSVPEGPLMSAEPELKGFSFIENTDVAKPAGPDVGTSVGDAELYGRVLNESARSKERQLPSGSESQKTGKDKQQEQDDNSKMDVDIDFARSEDDSEQKVSTQQKAFFNMEKGSDTLMPSFESKDEESRTNERESTLPGQKLKVSEVKGKAAESDADHLPEQSRATGTRHQAPLFGIQLSMPIKTGPVSFSSPPKFPRYSMNPQAVPFFPSKRSSSDGSLEKSKSIVAGIATPPDVVDQEKMSAIEAKQESASAPEDKASVGSAVSVDKNAKTEGLLSKEISTPAGQSDGRPSDVLPTQAITRTDKTTKGGVPDEGEVERGLASESEPFLKKPAPKKVSFAPTPVKDAATLQKLEKEQGVQRTAAAKITQAGAKQGDSTSKLDGHSALVDTGSESNEVARLGKTPTDTDAVKEKQRIIQVQTDEGLRREVANVTVAIRQDNSKMKLDRKKLTIQLTTGTEESGKLQFFKGSGSSLKLYASLESKKDYLRVRKVTNRQYCMSVAKMAPPGDDAADIVEKYFVHFDERDIFEEMYSQCVANLQKQPKSIPHFAEPDRSKRALQTPGEESTEEVNRQSTTKSGVKRSAENDNATQASKKSKLLADKKKLLDKMAALRRKKEQKGGVASKGRQSQPVASHSGRSSLPSADSGTRKSAQQTDKKLQPKSENTERNTSETPLSVTKVTHPSKKRASEKASRDIASKRARVNSSISAAHEAKIASASKSGAEPKRGQSASAPKDGIQGVSTEAKTLPTTQPNSSKGQQTVALKQSRKSTDTKLPDVDSDRPQYPDAGALVKVTDDFKKAQKERNALRQELAAREHSLLIERAKTSQVEREHSQAWQRIMSLVEALGDDMGRLRREETDRSMASLKRCEPSSSEDFFDRLHSFRSSTWAAFENSEIGALECALKGWHNSGPNTIRSSEGSEITLSPCYDELNLRQSEVERICSLLREGHSLLSGWIGQACPESFRTFAGSQRILTKENLRANTETLRGQGFDGGDLRFDWGANALLLSDDVCEKLAAYNWSVDGECLRCIWCNRRVAVHGESRFNATSKHYAFCPFRSESWKDSVLCNARTLGIEGDGDILMRD